MASGKANIQVPHPTVLLLINTVDVITPCVSRAPHELHVHTFAHHLLYILGNHAQAKQMKYYRVWHCIAHTYVECCIIQSMIEMEN